MDVKPHCWHKLQEFWCVSLLGKSFIWVALLIISRSWRLLP
jgi:hypothetical protein